MRAASVSEAELLTELQLAVERDELSLLYQPKVAVADNRLVGVEALARWPHRTLGLIEPSTFVPLAERYGLIDELTDWVLRRGLKQWVTLERAGAADQHRLQRLGAEPSRRLFPRLSPPALPDRRGAGQLPDDRGDRRGDPASGAAARHPDPLPAEGDEPRARRFRHGLFLAAPARQLPYNELKVDHCFVGEAVRSRESRLIVKAVIDLAHGLGLTATAEGVEDAETLALLAELGCDHAQGYFIARAMEGWELAPWLMAADGEGVVPIAAARRSG